MRGNIEPTLTIKAGDKTTVVVKGWIEFQTDDPDSVQVWVGVGQGEDKADALYGRGWCTVERPAPGDSQRTTWECDASTAGAEYKNGQADAGAVVIGQPMKPYPWGRDVRLTTS